MEESSVRLSKLLAVRLGIGRRQADILIEEGKVRRNGHIANLGERAMPEDTITVNGKAIAIDDTPELIYLALHKPAGYVCSRRQQGDTPTIYALLPQKYHHLQPVGRLDKDSSGLLLLTNDGDFALRMTHPSFKKVKHYIVTLKIPLEPLHRQMISEHGLALPDGVSKFSVNRLKEGDDHTWEVVMHEGRNRQIRRTFGGLGYNVIGLHRTQFGIYSLADLEEGKWQELPSPRD